MAVGESDLPVCTYSAVHDLSPQLSDGGCWVMKYFEVPMVVARYPAVHRHWFGFLIDCMV
jgi:hypothetical protein